MQDFEMPCLCDCGEWFDLNDGFADRNSNIIVCAKCHENNQKIERLRDGYYDLDRMEKPYKREKKKILKMLADLGAEL
jgi:hypothetical protein